MSNPRRMVRPEAGGCWVTTPAAGEMLALGGKRRIMHGVALAEDERKHLVRVYGFVPEENPLLQAGADIGLLRCAQLDGIRLVAWLGRYLEAGEDPLKLLIRMVSDLDYEVDARDVEWAESDDKAEDTT